MGSSSSSSSSAATADSTTADSTTADSTTADSTTNGQNDTKTSGSKAVIDFSLTVEYIAILRRENGNKWWDRDLRDFLVETAYKAATSSATAVFSERTSPLLKDLEDAYAAAESVHADAALKAEATYIAALKKAEKEAGSYRKEGQPGFLEAKFIATNANEEALMVALNDSWPAKMAAGRAYCDAVRPAMETYKEAIAPAETVFETIKGEEDPVFSDTLNGALKVFEAARETAEAARKTAEAASIADVESAKPPEQDKLDCCDLRLADAQTTFDKSCKAACDPVFKRFCERFEAAMATSVDTSH